MSFNAPRNLQTDKKERNFLVKTASIEKDLYQKFLIRKIFDSTNYAFSDSRGINRAILNKLVRDLQVFNRFSNRIKTRDIISCIFANKNDQLKNEFSQFECEILNNKEGDLMQYSSFLIPKISHQEFVNFFLTLKLISEYRNRKIDLNTNIFQRKIVEWEKEAVILKQYLQLKTNLNLPQTSHSIETNDTTNRPETGKDTSGLSFKWGDTFLNILSERVTKKDRLEELIENLGNNVNVIFAGDGACDLMAIALSKIGEKRIIQSLSGRTWIAKYNKETKKLEDIIVIPENEGGDGYTIEETLKQLNESEYFKNLNYEDVGGCGKYILLCNVDHHSNRNVGSTALQTYEFLLALSKLKIFDVDSKKPNIACLLEPISHLDPDAISVIYLLNLWAEGFVNRSPEIIKRVRLYAEVISIFDVYGGNPPLEHRFFTYKYLNEIFGEDLIDSVTIPYTSYKSQIKENLSKKVALYRLFAIIYKVCGNWDIILNQLKQKDMMENVEESSEQQIFSDSLTEYYDKLKLLIFDGLLEFYNNLVLYYLNNIDNEHSKRQTIKQTIESAPIRNYGKLLELKVNTLFLTGGEDKIMNLKKTIRGCEITIEIFSSDEIQPDTLAFRSDHNSFIKVIPPDKDSNTGGSISVYLNNIYIGDGNNENLLERLKAQDATHLVLQITKSMFSRIIPALFFDSTTQVIRPAVATFGGSRESGYYISIEKMKILVPFLVEKICEHLDSLEEKEFGSLIEKFETNSQENPEEVRARTFSASEVCAVKILSDIPDTELQGLLNDLYTA
jgi:hypothetical protein